jgi:hypothetical protein
MIFRLSSYLLLSGGSLDHPSTLSAQRWCSCMLPSCMISDLDAWRWWLSCSSTTMTTT